MEIIRDKILLAKALEWIADPKHTNDAKEHGFHYKGITYDYEKQIFPSARNQFQKYNQAYSDNKDLAEAFARDLRLKNKELIAEINKGAKTPQEQIFYEEGIAVQSEGGAGEQPPVGETSSTMTEGGSPFPGIPGGANVASGGRRVIHIIPQEEAESKLLVTNKSGVVINKPAPQSGLIVADKGGAVVGERVGGQTIKPAGRILEKEMPAAEQKLIITNKSGVPIREHAIRNVGSSARSRLGSRLSNVFGPPVGAAGRGMGNLLVRGLNTRVNPARLIPRGASFKKSSLLKRRVFLIFLFSFGLGTIFALIPVPSTPPVSANPILAPIAGGDISSCNFYRKGDRAAEQKLSGNPSLLPIVTDTAARVGIPAAILAGILRVETGSSFVAQRDYDAAHISADYDAHSSGVAYGIMQFTPDTFTDTFNGNKTDLQTIYGKTEARNSVDPQSSVAPNNVLRIYSIKDSIIAAAFKIRTDKKSINGEGAWDEATVRELAARYYGRNADRTTNYPGWDGSTQNYGTDLWLSYSGCQSVNQPPAGVLASCPVSDAHTIANGTKAYPISGGGGHCDASYTKTYPFWCPPQKNPGVSHAIDVAAADRTSLLTISLPTIENKAVDWEYKKGNYADSSVSNIGYGHDFSAVVDGHSYFLHLFHLDLVDQTNVLKVGQTYKSSTPVAKMYNMGGPHVHLTISKDGTELEPHLPPPTGMNMCN